MPKTKDRVSDATETVKPYVQRALKDEELRESVKSAFDAARDVYNELFAGRGMVPVATRVATDKDIQDNLKSAVDDLRNAADRLRGKQEDHGVRNMFLLLLGIAIGALFNPVTGPATRKWVSDKVFGSSDDFTYQSSGNSGSGSGSASSTTTASS
jgi:hypothetical protein